MSDEEVSGSLHTVQRPSLTPAPTAAFLVTVESGPDRGASVDVDGTEEGAVLVGKSSTCRLRLTDPQVSRRHLSLELTQNALRVVDLGSTNGTFVNGLRVSDAMLVGGESIRVGDTVLAVQRRRAANVVALPPQMAFGELVAISREMRRLFPLLEKLAASNVPVLIEGETGTGKEVLAESLHQRGPRAGKPFVVFDCTSVAPSLVESELFGHERGAFTGATTTRKGVFELASGGTLLIDEIGDLDLSLQPKLLRALERSEIRRVGGSEVIKVDVRVISATRRDLDHEVQAERFRDDLFHRLVVARVELPPLRRRRGDVSVLARHFARQLGGEEAVVPANLLAQWDDSPWPGNVRELRNAVARFVALGELAVGVAPHEQDEDEDDERAVHADAAAEQVASGDAPPSTEGVLEELLAAQLPLVEARQRLIEAFDRAYLARALSDHGGNVTRAAAAAGLARRNFQLLRQRRRV